LVIDAEFMVNVRDTSAAEMMARWRQQGGTGPELATAAASAGARRIGRRVFGDLRARGAALRGRNQRS
jgi:hypothetical protein